MTVTVADAASCDLAFPEATHASRILVKPNLGYPVRHPVTVSLGVLRRVVAGLRAAAPGAEIFIVEGVCSRASLTDIAERLGVTSLLDDRTHLLDADALPCRDYPHARGRPNKYASMSAPALLDEVDFRVSVGTFKRTELGGRPLISASLKNLYGLFPRATYAARSPKSRGQLHRPSVPEVLEDVYFCIGHRFDYAVVDGTQRYVSPDWKPDRARAAHPFGHIVMGPDVIAVDRRVCELAGEPVPDYVRAIETRR
ncbi:MAG: DUF362 domain-containing protein [Myxococcota bacterium]